VNGPVVFYCQTGSGFGRGHDGQHAPQDPVAASRLSLARGTDGKLATAQHGTEVATPASAGVVILACREGTVAVGFTSGKGGGLAFLQGAGSSQWTLPVGVLRFRPEAANAGCPGKSAERGVAEPHVSFARGPRCSQQLCYQCQDTGGRTRLVR
jgi:hypothetical protein